MADQETREPAENAAPGRQVSLPKRVWAWFNAQGLVAKFVVSIVTAVATALAVGIVTRSAFDSGSGPPPTTTLARDAAPFTVSTRIVHGDYWKVWLAKPLPTPKLWPGPNSDPETLLRFLDKLGAVDDLTWARITLDGTAGRTSTITGARARVLQRSTPSPAAEFTYPHEGEQDVIGLYFDLDESGSPAHELISFATPSREPYFAHRTITVAPGEAVTLDVNATTQECDCQWVLELDVVVDGVSRTVRIDDNGKPFHTSAGKDGVAVYLWDNFHPQGQILRMEPDGTLVPAS
jgi:hypothetical protein